jgi:hypothetical protein
MSKWYILDNNNKPIPATSIIEAAEWLEKNPERKAVKQENIGDIFVSTVFLGLDHAWNSTTPILWETMIFGGEHDQYQERYTSHEDALKGHEFAVELVKSLITKE